MPLKQSPAERIEDVRLVTEATARIASQARGVGASRHADERALSEVLALLHARTGADFSSYKRATVVRRIARRVQAHGLSSLNGYLALLRSQPEEAPVLLRELLISVTGFFRDPVAFTGLANELSQWLRDRAGHEPLRVWVPGCATGEEAYSIAVILAELLAEREQPRSVQIFATDLDEEAIRIAREGLYPVSIADDVSEERLRRFFTPEPGGFRVRREIRDGMFFAVHDLLRDPPFSRLDLITCRNLLIYLRREAQARALRLFHFGLRPGGCLFLGTSESVEDGHPLFGVADRKLRLYFPRPASKDPCPAYAEMTAHSRGAANGTQVPTPAVSLDHGEAALPSWGEVHCKLIVRFAAPSVLVDHDYKLLHLSENAGRFLHIGGGVPTRNLLQLVDPVLRPELQAALERAAQGGGGETVQGQVEIEGMSLLLRLLVRQAREFGTGFYLVSFEVVDGEAQTAETRAEALREAVARRIERELESLKVHLREVVQQAEASNGELKVSNHKLEALNEEMRTAAEDLESGREEMQSINEELTTVNRELKTKVDELASANSDLRNLMESTTIATVFLDRELRITRYTPSAVKLFHFIPTDLGRPLSDLAQRADHAHFQEDAARALADLAPVEREAQIESRWFLVRIQPYRCLDERVAGVVLTFVDITRRKRTEGELQAVRELLEARVQLRTAELDAVNGALRNEMLQRTRAEEARQALLQQLMTAQEQERSRISRGLHDEVGQRLTALILELKLVERAVGREAATKVKAMRASAEVLAREIHELAVELRPTALDDLGLARALAHYVEDWSCRTKVHVEFVHTGRRERRLPGPVETTLYRIVCEALNNVAKHARAKRVVVALQQRADKAVASIEDDGVGFDPVRSLDGKKLGIVGMRERAGLLQGELRIESKPGRGASVIVTLPVPGGEAAEGA